MVVKGGGINAFHLHNFFDDVRTLRFKYATYGHASRRAKAGKPFAEFLDKNTLRGLKCLAGKGGIYADMEPLPPYPVYFDNKDDVDRRHKHALKMLSDELRHV